MTTRATTPYIKGQLTAPRQMEHHLPNGAKRSCFTSRRGCRGTGKALEQGFDQQLRRPCPILTIRNLPTSGFARQTHRLSLATNVHTSHFIGMGKLQPTQSTLLRSPLDENDRQITQSQGGE